MKGEKIISFMIDLIVVMCLSCNQDKVWEKVNRADFPVYYVTVVATSPSAGETFVPTNTDISVTFSDNILTSTLTASTISVSNGVTFTILYDSNTKTVTCNPDSTLLQNTTYTVTLSRDIKNSANEGLAQDYSWSFTTASGLAPEIDVFQGIFPLNSGSTYDFGTILNTETRAIDFTIENSGTSDLTINSVTLGGAEPGEYILNTGAMINPLGAGLQTTFTVTFDPASTGVKNASIIIDNDDDSESTYTVYIKGYATDTSQPEIMLRQGLTEFVFGDNYDFGTVLIGSSSPTVTFTIYNIGNVDLIISSIAFDPDDPDKDMFILDTSGISSPVAAGASTSFTGRFAPNRAAVGLIQVRIGSNDIDESSFMFKFKGRGVNP